MNIFKQIYLFVFDKKELAFQILAKPLRKELKRREKLHMERKSIYEQLKNLRRYTLI